MSNRIEEIRRAKKLSMEALALAIGTTASTVNKLEKGQMRLTDKWITPIARALGVTPGELFDRTESAGIGFAEPGNRFIPVFGLAAGAVRGNHRMDNDPVEHLLAPPALAHVRDAYALIVTGTSMEPRYYSGEVVFIHPHRPVRGGDHVVLQERLDGGTTVSIKRFERMNETEIITSQYNPPAEIRFLRERVMAMHRVLTPNELFGI